MAQKAAGWLHNPCLLGGSPPLRSGGQSQEWPTSAQDGYITPAALGVPTASKQEVESEVAHKWTRWLHNLCHMGVPNASEQEVELVVAVKSGKTYFFGNFFT